jgi:carbonic anhydrase/acetyltransferase-like protein (isoleucine patch superfamily)
MIVETGYNAKIITYLGITPKIHPTVFLCDGVKLIGYVEIGRDSSVWYNCVIRGDVNYIRIGERTNIQDLSMLHVQNGTHPLIIGNDVSIAHSVTLHGCVLKDKCLVGIGAIILNGAIISSNSIVAAGALVKENFEVPEGVLVAGVPAKIIRDLKITEIEMIERTARNYVHYVEEYRKQII